MCIRDRLYGFILFLIANVGFEACLVFYNAYLPEIVPQEKQGWVSGLGFGVGYAGSALGLVMALPYATSNIQIVWIMVAGMFLIFSIPTFLYLPRDGNGSMTVPQAAVWGLTGFRELWGEVMAHTELRRYLLAYFFYIDGVLTAIYMSSTLASNTFGYEQTELIYLYLAIQIAALIGAFLLAKPTDYLGPKKVGIEKMRNMPATMIHTICMLDVAYGSAICLLYTSPSPRDLSTSRMPSSA